MPSRTDIKRDRLDRVLVGRGLAVSREEAGRLILAGQIRIDGHVVDKPAKAVVLDAAVEVVGRASRYVSRGGEKLQAGLESLRLSPSGMVALDVGCSTGGFTDCLLQHGARRVYAVDVGYGQFDWRLRKDPRIVLLERTNIRRLTPARIPEPIQLAVVDVSFISLTLVLPGLVSFLEPGASVVVLMKPQFEVGKGKVGRGGVVREAVLRQRALEKVVTCAEALGFRTLGTVESPITGRKGNRETLVGFQHPG